ncbi:arginase family protein [Flavobacterium circumlabens]|uniref:Arginase n=1 Tax=Flavobacterium circumlabens TaxID=2133765 RepID=A0A4Y7UCU9_9FLAO|nr:arginase family protein [Flavobacterium circumlabens]TCN58791.1 arginase [Flavobacterium circumlabens]TEB44206.1 arginase family protein [Flavobacterium circumlabens]
MKEIYIVEFPSNLGLKEPQPGKEPGVKNLPDWFWKHNLHKIIQPKSTIRLDAPRYSNTRDSETQILNVNSLVDYAREQAYLVNNLLSQNKFPFVLGGDCSILLGSVIALKQKGNYGLFYLDGHTDFMDVSLSETGGVGGMAASIVTGNGPKKLTDMLNLQPYIKEENLWCVGNREYDDAYENQICNSSATYISLQELRKQGISNCIQSFLSEVENKNLDGFWLHIDADVLNDSIMPCVDSRTPDGLTYEEFNELTSYLFQSDQLTGLEITILDPDLDKTGQYTKEFVQNFTTTFKKHNTVNPSPEDKDI